MSKQALLAASIGICSCSALLDFLCCTSAADREKIRWRCRHLRHTVAAAPLQVVSNRADEICEPQRPAEHGEFSNPAKHPELTLCGWPCMNARFLRPG